MLNACLHRFEAVHHVLWPDPFVELFRGQESATSERFSKSEFLAIDFERDLRCFLIADMQVERRY